MKRLEKDSSSEDRAKATLPSAPEMEWFEANWISDLWPPGRQERRAHHQSSSATCLKCDRTHFQYLHRRILQKRVKKAVQQLTSHRGTKRWQIKKQWLEKDFLSMGKQGKTRLVGHLCGYGSGKKISCWLYNAMDWVRFYECALRKEIHHSQISSYIVRIGSKPRCRPYRKFKATRSGEVKDKS